MRIERRKLARPLRAAHGLLALVLERVKRTLEQPGKRVVGIVQKGEIIAFCRNIKLLQKIRMDEAVDGKRQGALRIGIQGLLGTAQGELRILMRIVRPTLLNPQDMPLGKSGAGYGLTRRPLDQSLEKPA